MNISDFLAQGEANRHRRNRSLDSLGLSPTPVIYEPTHAEFSDIRAEEELILGAYREEYRLIDAELKAAKEKDDKDALKDITDRISVLTTSHQEKYEAFKAKYALMCLGEFERKPTDTEARKLTELYSLEVIDSIYQAMLSFSRYDKSLDDIKKT
jgi:hypothetical protein